MLILYGKEGERVVFSFRGEVVAMAKMVRTRNNKWKIEVDAPTDIAVDRELVFLDKYRYPPVLKGR